MSIEKNNEIGDNEIRIISQNNNTEQTSEAKKPTDEKIDFPRPRKRLIIGAIILGVSLLALFICLNMALNEDSENTIENVEIDDEQVIKAIAEEENAEKMHDAATVELTDTVISGKKYTIYTPKFGIPQLEVGTEAFNDSSAMLIVPAADVRGDNGQIVGTYVRRGQVRGRGERKTGYCAIIDGTITIGAASSTPLLEDAVDAGGDFFRQFPLVVGGQIIRNHTKGKYLGKALAEIDGEIVVVRGENNTTMDELAEALVNMGALNAIYLPGGDQAIGYRQSRGEELQLDGDINDFHGAKVNYIVWR